MPSLNKLGPTKKCPNDNNNRKKILQRNRLDVLVIPGKNFIHSHSLYTVVYLNRHLNTGGCQAKPFPDP